MFEHTARVHPLVRKAVIREHTVLPTQGANVLHHQAQHAVRHLVEDHAHCVGLSADELVAAANLVVVLNDELARV